MALKIRRGSNASRQTITPAEGELLYVTNHVAQAVSPVWVGDGSTAGGNALQTVISVNSQTGSIVLTTDNVTQGSTNKYFLVENAQDDVASLFTNGTHTGGIVFDYKDTTSPPRIDVSVPYNGTVNSGSSEKIAFYSATGTVVSATNNLSWNNTQSLLTVDNGAVTITAGAGPRPVLNLSSSFNSASSNSLNFNRSRGSSSIPTSLTNGDSIGNINFNGYTSGGAYVQAGTISAYTVGSVTSGIIPTGVGISVMGTEGNLKLAFRVLCTGQTYIGPSGSEHHNGLLRIVSQVNGSSIIANSSLSIGSYFSGADGQNIALSRARGTLIAPLPVQTNDEIFEMSFHGYDGTGMVTSAQITSIVDGTVSTGSVPGSLVFYTRNSTGTLTQVLKVSAPTSSSTVGRLTVSGTIATTSTPATFWNYDSSESTLTLNNGDVVTFASFSGSVLVNCQTSGTVSQYLCGGGSTPICIGSSKVTQTGTMQAISGAYTFTASEAGIHSFYVIRTRTGP